MPDSFKNRRHDVLDDCPIQVQDSVSLRSKFDSSPFFALVPLSAAASLTSNLFLLGQSVNQIRRPRHALHETYIIDPRPGEEIIRTGRAGLPSFPNHT